MSLIANKNLVINRLQFMIQNDEKYIHCSVILINVSDRTRITKYRTYERVSSVAILIYALRNDCRKALCFNLRSEIKGDFSLACSDVSTLKLTVDIAYR